jgi:predicted amidohydrolase YtcJ
VALTRDEVAIYQRVHRRHPIPVRVLMAPLVQAARDVDWLRELGVHTGSGDSHLKFGYAKMFADGGMGAATIAIHPPGVGDGTNLGLLIWKADELERVQRQLVDMGWQLGTHAIGDRAIDQVLDSYERISAHNPGRDLRHRVVHCGVATPAIQRRLAQGHVLVDSNPAFVYWIGSWFLKYGSERLRYSYPARSYIEQGIVASAGSDVNVTPLSPWWGIWAAVERRELASGAVLAPEERIPVREALRMYTQNGAYAGFEEKDKGSLETGKFADFVVLDRDPLVIPSAQLRDVRVLATFVGGVAAYDSGLAEPANRSAGASR